MLNPKPTYSARRRLASEMGHRRSASEMGYPFHVRGVYCLEPKIGDCYTVLYDYVVGTNAIGKKVKMYVSMNASPTHPTYGICQHGEYVYLTDLNVGKRILFNELPEECQLVVLKEIKEMEV